MAQLFSQFSDLLGICHDPATSNVVSMLACIALYCIFLNRDRSSGNVRRRFRCPDSILRGA